MSTQAKNTRIFVDKKYKTQIALIGVEEQPGCTLRFGPATFEECIEWIRTHPALSDLDSKTEPDSSPELP